MNALTKKISDAWRKLCRGDDVIYSRRFEATQDNHIRSSGLKPRLYVQKSAQATPDGNGLYSIDVTTLTIMWARESKTVAHSAADGHSLFTRSEAISEIMSLEKNFKAEGLSEAARQPKPRLLAVNAKIVSRP